MNWTAINVVFPVLETPITAPSAGRCPRVRISLFSGREALSTVFYRFFTLRKHRDTGRRVRVRWSDRRGL